MSSATTALLSLCVLFLARQASGTYLPRTLPRLQKHINTFKISRPIANRFNFTNCGGPGDLANFKSLTVSPDPITTPGNVKLSFEVDVRQTIEGNVDLNVTMMIRASGTWMEVPCVLMVGSCNYLNICSYLQPIEQCPEVLTKNNIPCKCPFKPGTYKLPVSSFQLEDGLPAGDYYVGVVLRQGEKQVACAKATFSFAQ